MTSKTQETSSAGKSSAGPSFFDMAMGMALIAVGSAYALPFIAADNETVANFSVVFSSIMLEAMPFMLLGTLVGGIIEVFISRERMESLLPRRDWASACVAAALGIVFPVCECAIVPVVRRLAGKGLPAAAAMAYLLAGPIVNPVVGLSTALAYNFDWRPVAVRLGFGYVIAVGVALILARIFRHGSIFVAGVAQREKKRHHHSHAHGDDGCGCGHHHGRVATGGAGTCGCGCGHDHDVSLAARVTAACIHALNDFMATAPYLVAGAAIAAVAQTCVERRVFVEMAATPAASSFVMMLLAVLLNLCSEADAFIAASFRGLVPFSAQMAFLVVGPMFDIKLLLMYRNLFKARVVPLLAALVVVAVAAMALFLELVKGWL